MFVANSGSSSVSVVDAADDQVTATISLPANADAQIEALDPSTGAIYVADFGPNLVSVINPANNTVAAKIPAGDGPLGVAFDATTGQVLVTNQGSSTASVIDPSSNTVVATIDDFELQLSWTPPSGAPLTAEVVLGCTSSTTSAACSPSTPMATLGPSASSWTGVLIDGSDETCYAIRSEDEDWSQTSAPICTSPG